MDFFSECGDNSTDFVLMRLRVTYLKSLPRRYSQGNTPIFNKYWLFIWGDTAPVLKALGFDNIHYTLFSHLSNIV